MFCSEENRCNENSCSHMLGLFVVNSSSLMKNNKMSAFSPHPNINLDSKWHKSKTWTQIWTISEEELSVKNRFGSDLTAGLRLFWASVQTAWMIWMFLQMHQTCTLHCLHLLKCSTSVVFIYIQDISAYGEGHLELLSWWQLRNVMYLARCNTTWKGTDIYSHSWMKYCFNVLAITTLEQNQKRWHEESAL